MKTFKEDIVKIYQNEHWLLVLIVLNLLLSIGLLVFSLLQLNPNASVVKIGYGDIGGYRDGTWASMFVFPLLAILFGVVHNLLAIKIFHKRGSGMAKFFLLTTTALVLGTFLVLTRLLGEV